MSSYIENSRWANSKEPIVRVLRGCDNACHAIREMDRMDVLRSDPFIIMSGDVVSNVNLKPVIEAHKARRKNKSLGGGGRNNVMTMVFSRVDPVRNRLRRFDEELLVAINSETKQIIKFESNRLSHSNIKFTDSTVFEEHPSVDIHYDLLDCCIDVCSQEMVNQIAENYDYKVSSM